MSDGERDQTLRLQQNISNILTKPFAGPESLALAEGIKIGDEVAIRAKVQHQVTEDRVSVTEEGA
ncbi:hypothetical protein ACWGTO_18695 [Mesorhizobium sp. PL10]